MTTFWVAPGEIINLILSQQSCTSNKAHLLPVPPSLLSRTRPLLQSPYNSNWRLLKEHKRSRVSLVGRSSGSAINHMSQTHHKFLFLPPQYWEFPLFSAAVQARRTVWLCKPSPWIRGTTSCDLWGAGLEIQTKVGLHLGKVPPPLLSCTAGTAYTCTHWHLRELGIFY